MQNSDEPPFNFRSMLRKTNYSRPDDNSTTYEFNSQNQQTFQAPKLRPTGKRFDQGSTQQFGGANKFGQRSSPDYGSSSQQQQTNDSSGGGGGGGYEDDGITSYGDSYDI